MKLLLVTGPLGLSVGLEATGPYVSSHEGERQSGHIAGLFTAAFG